MPSPREDWNSDIREDLHVTYDNLVVYSRDWTVDTVLSQLRQGNIDVNPKFQRRNAWTDTRRSLLIESLILGIPVPELVLAEERESKKKFVVLDGKQRLLTLAGFVDHDVYGFWRSPTLTDLKSRPSLNSLHYETISEEERRSLMNADMRCTVISNYDSDDILYDIFYRLNTGSVALSTQELRQVLKRGEFANYLIEITNRPHPIQEVLKLKEPDPRLRDVEILLRYLAFELQTQAYRGDLKRFLDETMEHCNVNWNTQRNHIRELNYGLGNAIALGTKLLDATAQIGRKIHQGSIQSRFNKAVFETQIYYFRRLVDAGHNSDRLRSAVKDEFQRQHERLWNVDEFVRSVEVTTKSIEQYRIRFSMYEGMVNRVFDTDFAYSQQLFPRETT